LDSVKELEFTKKMHTGFHLHTSVALLLVRWFNICMKLKNVAKNLSKIRLSKSEKKQESKLQSNIYKDPRS